MTDEYENLLANYMFIFTSGTKQDFDTRYTTRFGSSFIERSRKALGVIDRRQQAYNKVRDAAKKSKVYKLAVNPLELADRSDDGSTSTTGRAVIKRRDAARNARRCKRFTRHVARAQAQGFSAEN